MLTNTAVKNAKAKEKSYKLTDGEGLYLLVQPNGSKYWRFKYMFLCKEKLLSFGTYPEITLEEARAKRLAARKLVMNGVDPSQKKQEEKRLARYNASNSFQIVAQEWYNTNLNKWTPDHAARLWRRLDLHVLSELGCRSISEIKPLDLLDVLRKVEKLGKTETSHRLLQTCGVIFRYAIVTGRVSYNPAQDLKGALMPHQSENHPTIQAKELPHFYRQLESVDTTRINKIAIEILMLTFVRQGELRQAQWADVDLDAKEWRLPAHTTKMRDMHIVPLSRQVIDVLHELKSLTGHSELLFPSQQRRRHAMMSENTVNHVLQKMGYKGKLVGHGFRALASTTLNEMGFRADVIERQLAHMERNKVRAAYNRAEYLDERRKMMQHWADYLEAQQNPSNILAFSKAPA